MSELLKLLFERTGTCNRCGQCCGADGSPNQANPWPVNWYESHQRWSHASWESIWPYTVLFGIVPGSDGRPIKTQEYGQVRIVGQGGGRYYYVWVDGRPCKDTSAGHDGTSHSLECPFLKDDPGDGSRPCALVGSQDDGARHKFCRPEERPEPPPNYDIWDDRSVDQWQTDHPNCSYEFVSE